VEFDFTPEQHALRELARDLFEKESPPSRLRELYDGGTRDGGVWRAMGAVGLLGLTIPEEHGGTGGDELDLALVLEEAGRAALPEPLLETAGIAAPSLVDAGVTDHLARIAEGEALATVRLGGSPYAVDADRADVLIEERDGELYLVERGSFTVRPVPSEDRARRLFAIEAPASGATRLSGGRDATARARMRGAVAAAGVLNGISTRLVEMTVAYVKDRQQFGRPVGSFQAVKHQLTDAHVAVEAARAATWYAAYALARGLPDAPLAASVAKAQAGEASATANRGALQLHGGIGFTWEHDLHLWLKRGKALEQSYGSAREHRAIIARQLVEDGIGDA
jgi:alkylation response protein AidB-like acyl-CoA dehydrogenase